MYVIYQRTILSTKFFPLNLLIVSIILIQGISGDVLAKKIVSSQKKAMTISKIKALEISFKHGLQGTWFELILRNEQWQIFANSKSDMNPMCFVVDAESGRILYQNMDFKAKDLPLTFQTGPILKRYRFSEHLSPAWEEISIPKN